MPKMFMYVPTCNQISSFKYHNLHFGIFVPLEMQTSTSQPLDPNGSHPPPVVHQFRKVRRETILDNSEISSSLKKHFNL